MGASIPPKEGIRGEEGIVQGMESSSALLEKVESGYALPRLSTIAMRLVEMAADDNCSAKELAELIEKDPSLAVRVLKLANSSFFQTGRPTASLSQAVVKLGFQQLRIMALSLSLRDTFPMGQIGVLDYEKFWRASLYRAILARDLVSRLQTGDPEETFVAGLIMEVGLLILFDLRISEDQGISSIELEPLEDLLAWERDRYGIDHRQIGESALRFWRFPERIVSCQTLWGDNALAQNASLTAKAYELSRQFSRVLEQESVCFTTVFEAAERIFELRQDLMIDTIMATFGQIEGIAQHLNLKVNSENDLLMIMEKANRALSSMIEAVAKTPEAKLQTSLPSFASIDRAEASVAHTLQAVAHEIRNPLQAIGGFARRLSHSLDPATRGGKYAQVIMDETSRLEKVMGEMTQNRGPMAS
jgi:HD-like signal output (HDOD) protein